MVDQVLQNWGHYGKGWGLVSSNWHPLLQLENVDLCYFLSFWNLQTLNLKKKMQWRISKKKMLRWQFLRNIFEKLKLIFFYIKVFHSMCCSWRSLTNSAFHEFSFDRRIYVQFWSVVAANPFLEVYTICPRPKLTFTFDLQYIFEVKNNIKFDSRLCSFYKRIGCINKVKTKVRETRYLCHKQINFKTHS